MDVIQVGSVTLDRRTRRLKGPLGEIAVPNGKPLQFLALLMEHPKKILTFDDIIIHLYGRAMYNKHSVLKVYLVHIRRLLDRVAHDDICIVTHRRRGYELAEIPPF